MQIRVDVQDEQVRRALDRLSERVESMRPAMSEIGEIVRSSVEWNFAAGGRPRWADSARVRSARGQTLSDTGRLRRSFARPGAVRPGSDRVAVGTNVVYAAIQRFGGRPPPRVIRPRKAKALFWPGARHPVKSVNHPGSLIPASSSPRAWG